MRSIISFSLLLATLLLGCVIVSSAQTYDISWYKIAGGGGTSSNGTYSVTGTIGQHDAGNMSGGNYSLTGGFWGIIATVQTPGLPLLTISRITNNHVTLTWPTASTGFRIQQEAVVGTANWVAVNTNTFPITVNNSSNTITLPVSGGNQFFRLVNP